MSQPSMPKVYTGGEGDWSGGDGGGGVHRVELVRAITSVKYHLGTSVLDRETKLIKFNGNRIFTCKITNRNKVFKKGR